MVDAPSGKRIEKSLAHQARDYAIDHRAVRRGVHGALIAVRLAYALERGADLAVVITTPGSDSQRNLEASYGFRVGYTTTLFEAPQVG